MSNSIHKHDSLISSMRNVTRAMAEPTTRWSRFSHALRGKKPPLKMKFSPFYVSVDYDDRCVANVMGVGG